MRTITIDEMKANITRILTNKKQFLELLLLGDEQESMIDRYLERGEMVVLEENGIKAVCVVTDEGEGTCELKNIAFYLHCGFTYSHRVENFFINHYDHPIIEDGIQLKDMVYLKYLMS